MNELRQPMFSWRVRSQHQFSCHKCNAKCLYKKVNESFILHKYKPHTCNFVEKKKRRGKKSSSYTSNDLSKSMELLVIRNPTLSVPTIMDAMETSV